MSSLDMVCYINDSGVFCSKLAETIAKVIFKLAVFYCNSVFSLNILFQH